jgi:DNA-binding NtrC family response regulator
MQALYKEIGLAAASPVTVLLRGETGAGKELVAKAIHQHSRRASQPFIAVSCTAIPETLLESELFGHERGAFTGAHARRIGRFEQAHQGTIFQDEVGDLSPSTQVKLLRVLQEKCLQRVGGNQRVSVDVRVLAATHRDLETAMEAQQFREDLFYRLSALTIWLPPLRERLEDVPALVSYFLRRAALEIAVEAPSIHPQAVAFLQSQPWPGNVRELENVICHALLLARDHPISLAHVQHVCARTRRPLAPKEPLASDYLAGLLSKAEQGEIAHVRAKIMEDVERELFAQAIRRAGGNQAKAGRWLGVTRTTMREKLTHFGLHPAASQPGTTAP